LRGRVELVVTETAGNPSPVRVLVARTVSFQGTSVTSGSVATLFQGVCGLLRDGGQLSGVYDVLGSVKQRILNAGQTLSMDDVVQVVTAHNQRSGPGVALVVGPPRMVMSVRGVGDRLAFHREFVLSLQLANRPQMALDPDALIEVLLAILQARYFSAQDRALLLNLSFPQQEGLGALRILDTLYKATFSRTIRKDLCDHKIALPLPPDSFQLRVDPDRIAHLTMPCFELFRHLLFRLYRTPDLASVLDADDRAKARIQEGMRLFTGALHDAAVLPQKRQEVEAILKDRRGPEEDLEEL